ncbi:MAG: 3-deoxy-manno-octulosonate cytidylyltransferase [Phycisphaerales bacterium]|nr:MAG: 3-deoxy-manno-octulosonate cytidylyltransferase [Phycisphaerales bacterium]
MTTIAVIPARYASTRFCGKALANKTGKYLIQHVYERVCEATLIGQTIVATDDDRIARAIESFGGNVAMTRADHPSGTDRVAEVALSLGLDDKDLVVNVQGDEPEIDPAALDRLLVRMDEGDACPIGTLAAPFNEDGPKEGPGSPRDPNCVKVVVNRLGHAMYFSRSLVPYPRSTGGAVDRPSRWLLHLGVYSFRFEALRAITARRDDAGDSLERMEALEQLRWLDNGFHIAVVEVNHPFVGIDTLEDYEAFVSRALAVQ